MSDCIMGNDVFTFLVGGKAGEGVKKAGSVAAHIFSNMGRHVFQMDDYMSLIRGGHNFNVLTFSDEPVYSNEKQMDILIALDENTEKLHRDNLKPDGILLEGAYSNVYFAGKLFKILGIEFKLLEDELRDKENFQENCFLRFFKKLNQLV